MKRFFAFTLLVLAIAGSCGIFAAQAQSVMPRSGQSFSFGIPEGPDNLLGDSAQSLTTLQLTIVSMDSGCGVVISPSGFFLDFSFAPGVPTLIELPYNLEQFHDLGKTNKGILIHTSAPANVVFHDFAPEAGDATQIFPDAALDTNYVTFGWGIYDDILDPEHNNMEFVVTAPNDSTIVTITPSVNTLNGIPAGQSITVRLDRGECYIVKADTSDTPSDPSLSGSTVISTKPVSVVSALTCAYVPVGYESCNEILDELVGKKWWGSHFFVQPMGNADSGIVVVLTSDRQFFASVNNGFSSSINNRLVASFSGPAQIRTYDNNGPVRVEAHQLTRGSYFATDGQTSDPTLVTILDTAFYTDTMMWNTPDLNSSEGWSNWVPIICPTSDIPTITLDGSPLISTGALSSVINGSRFSAINPPLFPGVHTLISPRPIFALGVGFAQADAYSFIPGGAGPAPAPDTAIHKILLTPDSANVCSEFGVTASLEPPIVPNRVPKPENAMSLTVPISYDPAVMHFLRVEPHAVLLNNAQYTVDSSSPGIIMVAIAGMPFLEGSDLFRVVFEGRAKTTATAIGNNSTGLFGCGDATEKLSLIPTTIPIGPSKDTLTTAFTLANTTATICRPVTVSLKTDSVLTAAQGFALSQIEITFDTAAQQLAQTSPGILLNDISYTENGVAIGDYTLTVDTLTTLAGGDTLLNLTFVPNPSATSATLHARITYVRCYDTLTRNVTLAYPIAPLYDTTHTSLAVSTSTVSLGVEAEVDAKLVGLPGSANVKKFNLYVTYNHNVLQYEQANLGGTITAAWPQPTLRSGITTDTLEFSSIVPLSTSGLLAHLLFKTFVADSASSLVEVGSTLNGFSGNCPTAFISPFAATEFVGRDLCGDSVLRSFMHSGTITLDRALIDENGTLHVVIQSPVPADVTLTLTDVLGRVVWSTQLHCSSGVTSRDFTLPPSLASGQFTLSLTTDRNQVSQDLLLIK